VTEETDPRASLARQNARYRAATSDNPHADLSRLRKATTLSLVLSRSSAGLPASQRREALTMIADGIDKLTAAERDGVSDPVAYDFFRQVEVEAGVNRSSPATWARVAVMLRAMAGACVDDSFSRL
jgi:hypothetical protein